MGKRKTSSNAVLYSIVAILLVAVIVCGIITHGFKDWTPCGCFGHKYNADGICERCKAEKPSEEQKEAIAEDNNGNILESDKVYAMPGGMLFSSVRAASTEKSVTVKATVEPADATNKEVNWLVAFANESSAWATNKNVTDYVTITPSEADTLTATVTCKQAFGEQIVITCVSADDSNVSANCTVDYRKTVENVKLRISNFITDSFLTGAVYIEMSNAQTRDVQSEVEYSVGTVGGDEEVVVEYKFHEGIYNQLSGSSICQGHEGSTCTKHLFYNLTNSWQRIGDTIKFDINFVQEALAKFVPANYNTAFNQMRIYLQSYELEAVTFRITCGDWTKELTTAISLSNWKIAVTNIALDTEVLEF